MQKSPMVTVICLCYNHAEFVVETLNSVLNQSYPNVELIIADDCSTDNSVEVIENWLLNHPEILFIKNEKNLGNTKTFNKAFRHSKGDYLIDLAADDLLLSECISKQVNAFEVSDLDNLGIVYGNVANILEDNSFDSYYFPVDETKKVTGKIARGDIYLEVLTGEALCSVSSMVKRSVFEKLGGYDENLAYEDLDFWIRTSRTYNFEFIDDILVQKRIVKTSLTHDFHRKNSKRSRIVNYSTYLIIKKAYQLNKTKEEDLALGKRVNYELLLALKNNDFLLLSKYILLKIKKIALN
ncbi:glycosyltransferase [Flavobacterium sp. SM15]|uniref:glycosyltransferase n=1 Tax=Flavobacterium sp. SM15 TaxID=2908005 RepID=UPI001EDB0911|nr:glycosyltransferase [Flavobacterium sp. SM15]MCG2611005.1 glycosyltransferase [Flavobacterium sp. SM15]